jgi:excinuclease ABC subunit A
MGTFMGARKYVLHTFATTQSALMKKRVARYMVGSVCPECAGKRLKREALSVTFAGLDIAELTGLSLNRMAEVLRPAAEGNWARVGVGATRPGGDGATSQAGREATKRDRARRAAAGQSTHAAAPDVHRTPTLSEEKRLAAQRLAHDLVERIATLQALGLGYLAMDRATPTLSPGELQRLRLATQIRSNLFGVVYVLDEPSAGLHPADSEALHRALDQLKGAGNTIFVVEHDLDMMRRADWLVDVGPDAGQHGGRVLHSGPPADLAHVRESRTARYLFGEAAVAERRPRAPAGWLELRCVHRNNLHGLDARFPLGVFTAVTGVSGSGKSSLVSQALVDLVSLHLGHEPEVEEPESDAPTVATVTAGHLAGDVEAIRRLVNVDQKPIGRTPRSNLATYTGLFDHVRRLFAATKQAKARRYDAGRFSFNVAKGRCETCEGEGFVSVELLFMPSVYAPCPTCHGARYDAKTLEVEWNGRNIAQVLAMTVDEARAFFADEPALARPLGLLHDIGLGYLRLGQPATELSGGEAQRIKLATELQRSQRGDTLYVLDEPTTGLHPLDVDKLMAQLHGLVDAGNTVVVVEHELRVVAQADWVVDVGPGAGEEGGRIVVEGAPREVARAKAGRTAPYLRRVVEIL